MLQKYISEIRLLGESLSKRQAVLFVGAGMSLNAVPVHSHVQYKIKDWPGFMLQLAEMLWPHMSERELLSRIGGDYLLLTQIFKEQFGEDRFYQEFLKAVPSNDYLPSQLHLDLLELPWDSIITTNQDDLLEKGLNQKRMSHHLIVEDLDLIKGTERLMMKMHGTWDRASSLVFAEEDYRLFESKRPLISLKLKQIFAEKTVFFVGYSLRDEDFKRLLGWVRDVLGEYQKMAYAFIPSADQYTIQYWKKRNLMIMTEPIQGHDPDERGIMIQQCLSKVIKQLSFESRKYTAIHNLDGNLVGNYDFLRSQWVDRQMREGVLDCLLEILNNR